MGAIASAGDHVRYMNVARMMDFIEKNIMRGRLLALGQLAITKR